MSFHRIHVQDFFVNLGLPCKHLKAKWNGNIKGLLHIDAVFFEKFLKNLVSKMLLNLVKGILNLTFDRNGMLI